VKKPAKPKIIPELVMDRPLPRPDDPGLNADGTRAKIAPGTIGPSLQRAGGLDAGSGYRHKQVAHQRPPRKAISPGFFAPEPVKRRAKPPLVDIVRIMPDKISVMELAKFVNEQCGLAPHEAPTPHITYSSGQIRDEMKAQGFVLFGKSSRAAHFFVRAGSDAEAKLERQFHEQELPPPGAPLKDQILRTTTPSEDQL
jgi:hypothetical protein